MELTVQGRRAYAYTGGKPFDPALPTLVFLHGALHDHSIWTLLARWFAHHGHGVLAVDEPGHGRSEGPPLPDVEALADWTLALLDAAGAQQAALAGHSMGSLIALEAAGRAPERITRLVMIGTAYPMKVSEALLTTARRCLGGGRTDDGGRRRRRILLGGAPRDRDRDPGRAGAPLVVGVAEPDGRLGASG